MDRQQQRALLGEALAEKDLRRSNSTDPGRIALGVRASRCVAVTPYHREAELRAAGADLDNPALPELPLALPLVPAQCRLVVRPGLGWREETDCDCLC